MKSKNTPWNKEELKTYILLLCANADSVQSEEEINLIKSKVSAETFDKIFQEFSDDTEEEGLEKVEDNVELHYYSTMELAQLRKEMQEVFFADEKFLMMERNLDRLLGNIIY
jgi:hypothetical protein